MIGLQLFLLGPFSASLDGKPLTRFRTTRVQALLIYLTVEGATAPVTVQRDALLDLLWPGMPEKSARQNLRQTLLQLRKMAPAFLVAADADPLPLLLTDRQTVQLNPAYPLQLDVARFIQLLRGEPGQWVEAVEMVRGDLAEGFYLPGANTFEAWLGVRRAAYRQQLLDALSSLARLNIDHGIYQEAARFARRQLAIDNLRESAHRQLMTALARSGERSQALQVYEECRQLLQQELNIPPDPETEALRSAIYAGKLQTAGLRTGKLRGYQLKEQIGSGSFGVVYRAQQPAVGREVAIKIILPKYANDPGFIRRFEVEAQTIARLEHPRIVPLYDYWREPDNAYLVMRLLRGGSLADNLNDGLEPERAMQVVSHLAAGLEAAHRQGIIHRDLKPSNILLDEEGNAYLSDFGIAQDVARDIHLTDAGAIVGSPAYIAPEQLLNEPVTPLTDLYSLGLVMFMLLTGQHPYRDTPLSAMMYKLVHESLPPVQALKPALPAAVNDVIQKATARMPADRFASALELAEAFRDAFAGTAGVISVSSLPLWEMVNAGSLPDARPAAPPSQLPPHTLPVQATPFVGREAELAHLHQMLADADNRLITILAPGGMGKSRLAIEVGRTLLADGAETPTSFPDGIFFVPLEQLDDPDAIPAAILKALGILELEPDPGGRRRQLQAILSDKAALLILDNTEHLLDMAPFLAEIIRNAPAVQLLTTSRLTP